MPSLTSTNPNREPASRREGAQTDRQDRSGSVWGWGGRLVHGALAAVALAAVVAGSAAAGSLVSSSQIAANTIHGRDIHNGSIKGIDVKNGSLRRRDFKLASIRGPQGATGTAGAVGPQGPPGPDGVAGVRFLSQTVPSSGGAVRFFLSCASGEVVLGGGAESATPVDLHESTPFITSQGIGGWLVSASVRTGAFTLDVKAVCAP
jgi:hypothetical protein